MVSFTKVDNQIGNFGRTNFLRSTQDVKTETKMAAQLLAPLYTDNLGDDVWRLDKGVVLATITASGKVGVFDSGALDGRQLTANIVGFNQTDIPWQLQKRDHAVAAVYSASVVQAQCFEYVAGAKTALTDATRDAMNALPGQDHIFN